MTSLTAFESKFPVGSSANNKLGPCITARAMATRCFVHLKFHKYVSTIVPRYQEIERHPLNVEAFLKQVCYLMLMAIKYFLSLLMYAQD